MSWLKPLPPPFKAGVLLKSFETLRVITPLQVHGNKIKTVSKKWKPAKADGLITTRKNLAIGVKVADCLAIVVACPDIPAVGVVHAGWRGTKKRISQKLVKKLKKLGADSKKMLVRFSPCICGNCYEVGKEVAKHFKKYAGLKKVGKKYFLDLQRINLEQLKQAGVPEENIELNPECTFENPHLFSYRRNKTKQRMTVYIMIEDQSLEDKTKAGHPARR